MPPQSKEKAPHSIARGFFVVSLGIEPKSRASEAPILSVVLRDRCGAAKVATKKGATKCAAVFPAWWAQP